MKNIDKKYMKLALQEAQKAAQKEEIPIGAVIVKNDQVIGRGHNLKEKNTDPILHAEIIAIRQAADFMSSWRLEDCTIYVTLEPCSMCAGALIQARIDKLVFGAFDPKGGACGSLYNLVQDDRFNHQIEVKSGVLADESSKLLKEFFAQLRKK